MSPPLPFSYHQGSLFATVDVRVYRLAAVQKAAYRVAKLCTVVLGELRGDRIDISLTASSFDDERYAQEVGRRFFRELLDQELREQIGAETHALRTLIVAHAFSRTDLIERE